MGVLKSWFSNFEQILLKFFERRGNSFLVDFDEFDVENKGRVWRDAAGDTLCAVAHVLKNKRESDLADLPQ